MPFFLLFISLGLMASEVTTLNKTSNKSELVLVTTDDAMLVIIDKTLIISPCKPRLNLISGIVRENFMPLSCRAEIIKLILNAGFKPMDSIGTIFVK